MNTEFRAKLFLYFAAVIVAIVTIPALSLAHGIAGKRFFPTTFVVDDPFISDEFSILINRINQSGDEPNKATEINVDVSKRIIPNFGLEFHEAYLPWALTGTALQTAGKTLAWARNGNSSRMMNMS